MCLGKTGRKSQNLYIIAYKVYPTIKKVKYPYIQGNLMRIKTIKSAGLCIIILVAIYVMIGETPAVLACGLSDYICVFSALLEFSGIILILYLASKLL